MMDLRLTAGATGHVVIEGIRIDIRHASDGAISINGSLSQILAEQAGSAPAQPDASAAVPRAAEREPWATGLDWLQLRDSRIVFNTPCGVRRPSGLRHAVPKAPPGRRGFPSQQRRGTEAVANPG